MATTRTESTYATSKGRVEVPARLRRKYGIKEGTRLNFTEETGRIIIQPATKEYIRSFRGIFQSKPGEKSAVRELLEDRAAERAREDRKVAGKRREKRIGQGTKKQSRTRGRSQPYRNEQR